MNAEEEDEDDAVSMVDSPTDIDQADMTARGSSGRKRKKSAATNVGVAHHPDLRVHTCGFLRLQLLWDALKDFCCLRLAVCIA